jgi:enoyl-[acyl-carrier protein] reductase II
VKSQLLDRFFEGGRRFLGVDYPFVCGAMTWISDPILVSAVCNAGAFGCLAGGNAPPSVVEEQIRETRRRTTGPFGVNLITISPSYRDQLELICSMDVPYVIFAGSFPKEREVVRAKSCGAKVLCFASTRSIARRMLRYGADGLILEGTEAGGHIGDVALSVLIQQVLFEVEDVPVIVAGGIATGRMSAHMFLMGAAGVQLGTVFAVAEESCAHQAFKDKYVRANARDAVATPQFDSRLPVVAVRALRNRGHNDFARLQRDLLGKLDQELISRAEAQEQVEQFWVGALRRAVNDGDISHGSLMAGQSVGLVEKVRTVREIIGQLVSDTEEELRRVRALLR